MTTDAPSVTHENLEYDDPFAGYEFADATANPSGKRRRRRSALRVLPDCEGPVYSHFAFCVKWVEKRCYEYQRRYPDVEGLAELIRARLYMYMPNVLKNYRGPEPLGSPHWEAWAIGCLKLKAAHYMMLRMAELKRERQNQRTVRVVDGDKLLRVLDRRECGEQGARSRKIDLEDLMSRLPPYDAYLLRYVFMEGHTLTEMAETLGMKYRYQVKRHVDAALERTRAVITELTGETDD